VSAPSSSPAASARGSRKDDKTSSSPIVRVLQGANGRGHCRETRSVSDSITRAIQRAIRCPYCEARIASYKKGEASREPIQGRGRWAVRYHASGSSYQ
jgi:hypothetical protein